MSALGNSMWIICRSDGVWWRHWKMFTHNRQEAQSMTRGEAIRQQAWLKRTFPDRGFSIYPAEELMNVDE
jgi:hypothetical protein